MQKPSIQHIARELRFARLRLSTDQADTINSDIYVSHVEFLLRELDHAVRMNQLQAEKIRTYIAQPPCGVLAASGCAEEVMPIG